MADLEFDWEEIAALIRLVETRGLSELIVEDKGRRIVIRGPGHPSERQHHAPVLPVDDVRPVSPTAPMPPPAAETDLAALVIRLDVASPMVGVFYRAAGPDTPPFVDVGDRVEVGQTIGMIVAMK